MNKEQFYTETYPKFLLYCASQLRRPCFDSDVQDIASKALVKVLKNWDTYDPDRAKLDTWAMTILRNTYKDWVKKCKEINLGQGDTRAYNKMVEPPKYRATEHIKNILEALEEQNLEVKAYDLVAWVLIGLGYTYDEVSELIGKSHGTVFERVKRFRRLLLSNLNHDEDTT